MKRHLEVRGFGFADIKKRKKLGFPALPGTVHLLYRSPKLAKPVPLEIVAIPFSEIYKRKGRQGLLLSRDEIERKFHLTSTTKIVLTGVEEDGHVEQWWGTVDKAALIKRFRDLGVVCATTPNYSVIADVPRHDNMHSMKRIALSWAELHDGGVPTAFHINGRTNYDFDRLIAFLKSHREIAAIAFEFLTGAARQKRGAEFVAMLIALAEQVHRPLTLILRGGVQWIPILSDNFSNVVILTSDCTMKTRHRQKAFTTPRGTLRWRTEEQPLGSPLDEMFLHNIQLVDADLQSKRSKCVAPEILNQDFLETEPALKSEPQARDESPQMSLLEDV